MLQHRHAEPGTGRSKASPLWQLQKGEAVFAVRGERREAVRWVVCVRSLKGQDEQ